ncbi:hypothetical protein SSX86_032057 [Deinandra increscens subsp. villosa]|uniref:Uncharacterized protein n=1 Tax=Deinandra increscens subsp. villosa TaxID=3103831 RepID=A0AAP0GH52_9ASTR
MPSQLTRSPSLLNRVMSMNLSSFYATPDLHDPYNNSTSQLSRPPSLLQRVKSIDFSFSSFQNSPSTESERLDNSPSERTQTPSLLDRVKSFKLSPPLNSDQDSGYMDSGKDEDSYIDPHLHSVEDKELANVLEKSSVTPTNRSPNTLMEPSSENAAASSDGGEKHDIRRRAPAKKAVTRVHDESVDAKADDFIKRFKHQLKLQRLDSLQRLREMLNRGTSSSA